MNNQASLIEAEDDGVDDAIDEVPYAPAPERKVLIQTYDYAVRTLMDMVLEEDLVLDPDYQRHYRWSDEKASRFIESVSLNIPVPVIYLAEEADGSFSVIDGQQRLTSLFRFLKPTDLSALGASAEVGDLVLSGLRVRPELNNKRYSELSRTDKSTIAKRPIRCIVVLNESDSTLKFEVFERLNTGSLSLTDQEVRNCVYRGGYNTLIKRLAANPLLQEMVSLPDGSRNTMKDAELVLRFLAYRDLSDTTNYSDNYNEYLNSHMEENREISATRAQDLETLFKQTIEVIHGTLGPGVAFRKPLDRNNPYGGGFAHNLINGAIFESQMIAFSRAIADNALIPDVRGGVAEAFANDQYWNALFSGTAQRARAMRRSQILTQLLTA
jgi:hypothetical protein